MLLRVLPILLCAWLVACGGDDTEQAAPTPTPDATPEPTPSATPAASADPTPAASADPTPAVSADPTPAVSADPTPMPSGTPAPGWATRAPLPAPRQETAVVAFRGEIYVLGGFDNALQIVRTVEAYNPATNSWRTSAPLPMPLHHANAAAVGDRLIVAGFLSNFRFDEAGEVFVYDPAQDRWEDGAAMPEAEQRGAGVGVGLDDRMCVIGGFRDGRAVADASCYLPGDDRWEALPPLPLVADHLVAGAIDGVIYAAGGRDSGIAAHRDRLFSLRPGDADWVERAAMPTSRAGTAGAVAAGRLYVFGGEGNPDDESGVFPQVEAYDPGEDRWEVLEAMPTPRHGTGAASVDDIIYVPGGADVQAFGAVATHESYTPAGE